MYIYFCLSLIPFGGIKSSLLKIVKQIGPHGRRLNGKKATCYPGFEKYLTGATYTADLCTVDGNITTGRGPAAVLPFSYALLEQFVGAEATKAVRDGMIYTQLMEAK